MDKKRPTNLPQLQSLIKKDPESYKQDFEKQFDHYLMVKEVFKLSPTVKNTKFYDLANFISHLVGLYPENEEARKFPEDLIALLRRLGPSMHTDTRLSLIKCLILLRNKDLLPPMLLMDLCFELLRCQDKLLRKTLQNHIITDIKNINKHSKNIQLNKKLQDFFQTKLADNHAVGVKTALDVMIDLYKKGVWNNKRNVNTIVTATYHKLAKIQVKALKFFVGNDEGEVEQEESSESEQDAPNVKKALLAMRVNKKTRNKRQNKIEKIKKQANSLHKKKHQKDSYDFSALHLIYDPQSVAERVFKVFHKRNARFEVKILMMNLISRLLGVHQLYLPNFYPTLQRYMSPKQREVTKIMAFAAQAAHPLIPPDEVTPMLHCLANNFVTERYSVEVIAMGINAIREICIRNIHSMEEALLHDLLGFRNHRDRGVFMAARSLQSLFREKNPELLLRKHRGAPSEYAKETGVSKFGEHQAKAYIPGAEILAFNTKNEEFNKDDDFEYDLSGDSDDDDDEMSACDTFEGDEDEASEIEVGDASEGDETSVIEVDEASQIEADEDSSVLDTSQESLDTSQESLDTSQESLDTSQESLDTSQESLDTSQESLDTSQESLDTSQESLEDESLVKENESCSDESESEEYDSDCDGDLEEESKTEKEIKIPVKPLKKKMAIKEVMKLSNEQRATLATDITSARFLTDEDFAKIDAVQAAKRVERFKNKRKAVELEEESEIVPLSRIEMIYKKRRHDKFSKMETIKAGREGKEYGSKKGKINPFASKTNKEKKKTKAFSMIKHKVRYGKQKSSFADKKAKLKISLMRKMKNY